MITPNQPASVILHGERVPYTLRRSTRARHLRIRITYSGVEVVVPARARSRQASPVNVQAFLQDNAAWVLRHLHEMQKRHPAHDAGESYVFLRGRQLSLSIVAMSVPRSVQPVQVLGERVCIYTPSGPATARRILEDWLRREALQDIMARVQARSAQMGLQPQRVFIRNQRTKWGNCSSLGNLSFNWRLIGALPEVLDYIVVHELAHLQQMNHSPRFWAIVRAYCPDYVQHKAWLRVNEGRLNHLYATNGN